MHIDRTSGFLGTESERRFGFNQAVRAGDLVFISGQASVDESGAVVGSGDLDSQLRQTYANIARVLECFGLKANDIIDETIYVTNSSLASAAVPPVRTAFYGGRAQSACTMIGVTSLGLPDLMVEIRCIAACEAERR